MTLLEKLANIMGSLLGAARLRKGRRRKPPQLRVESLEDCRMIAKTPCWDLTASAGASPGGTGTWNTTTAVWWNGSTDVAWSNANGDTAAFVDADGLDRSR